MGSSEGVGSVRAEALFAVAVGASSNVRLAVRKVQAVRQLETGFSTAIVGTGSSVIVAADGSNEASETDPVGVTFLAGLATGLVQAKSGRL